MLHSVGHNDELARFQPHFLLFGWFGRVVAGLAKLLDAIYGK